MHFESTHKIGDATIHLLGTVQGFVPDAARVQSALNEGAVACVALGIPPEDLTALDALAKGATVDEPMPVMSEAATPAAGAPGIEGIHDIGSGVVPTAKTDADFDSLDPSMARFLELIGRFGETKVPSPDLDVAYHWCKDNDRRLEALDMDDEEHAELYIKANKFRHVLKSGRILKRIMKEEFEDAGDAQELACAWDAYLNAIPSLQVVESAREQHMADRLRELAKGYDSIVSVVPAARFAGVDSLLQSAPS